MSAGPEEAKKAKKAGEAVEEEKKTMEETKKKVEDEIPQKSQPRVAEAADFSMQLALL